MVWSLPNTEKWQYGINIQLSQKCNYLTFKTVSYFGLKHETATNMYKFHAWWCYACLAIEYHQCVIHCYNTFMNCSSSVFIGIVLNLKYFFDIFLPHKKTFILCVKSNKSCYLEFLVVSPSDTKGWDSKISALQSFNKRI